MDSGLLKDFVRRMLSLRWDEASQVYPPQTASEYLCEKERRFHSDRWTWFCTLDPDRRGHLLRVLGVGDE